MDIRLAIKRVKSGLKIDEKAVRYVDWNALDEVVKYAEASLPKEYWSFWRNGQHAHTPAHSQGEADVVVSSLINERCSFSVYYGADTPYAQYNPEDNVYYRVKP